jgi:hypothetical protein
MRQLRQRCVEEANRSDRLFRDRLGDLQRHGRAGSSQVMSMDATFRFRCARMGNFCSRFEEVSPAEAETSLIMLGVVMLRDAMFRSVSDTWVPFASILTSRATSSAVWPEGPARDGQERTD